MKDKTRPKSRGLHYTNKMYLNSLKKSSWYLKKKPKPNQYLLTTEANHADIN